jgi:hypothetical protein
MHSYSEVEAVAGHTKAARKLDMQDLEVLDL